MDPEICPTAPGFNWLTALHHVKEHVETTSPAALLEVLKGLSVGAIRWPTCACGQLCKDLPKHTNPAQGPVGSPKDETLAGLGASFYYSVSAAYITVSHSHSSESRARIAEKLDEAIAIFHRIELRTNHLLQERDSLT